MYVARYCRHDVLRAVGALASRIINWTVRCDKKLLRLIEYMECTKEWRTIVFVGDELTGVRISLLLMLILLYARTRRSLPVEGFWLLLGRIPSIR